MKHPLGEESHVKFIVLYILTLIGFIIICIFLANVMVSAAYNLSGYVTKPQIEKAEELGAIKRTELEVVNNYGEQKTIDTNQLQGSRNE